jgi:hypothetical protein
MLTTTESLRHGRKVKSMRAMCDRDGLQSRVSPDGAQEVSDVVAPPFPC